jgi:hypothetical protein
MKRALPLLVEAAFPPIFSLNTGLLSRPRYARLFGFLSVLLAVLFAAMALTALEVKSPTFDEPAHLAVGYSYWLKHDYRLGPENGMLPQRWAALPLLLTRPRFVSPENPSWQSAQEGGVAWDFFYRLGNNPEQMLYQGRCMMALFGGALCLLIYRCSRQFFGPLGGLLSEALAVFDPTVLAHGALVTSDITVAFFFLAAVWSVWQMLIALTPGRVAWAALSVSGLFLAKLSAVLVLPMIALLCVICFWSRDPIKIELGSWMRSIRKKWHKFWLMSGVCLLLGMAVWLSIWAAFGFRFSALTSGNGARQAWASQWNYNLAENSSFDRAIIFSHQHRLLPEAYLLGLACVHRHSAVRPAFLDQQWSLVGFRWFFPRAFFYKTTIGLLSLIMVALIAALRRWRNPCSAQVLTRISRIWPDLKQLAPFWVLALVYGGFALASALNIGLRHLLPVYPALFILCGASVLLLQSLKFRIAMIAIAAFLICHIAESFAVRPDYLAFFNQFAGGPQNGYRHLIDSSLDWGQDLPGLKDWLQSNVPPTARSRVYLAYFGSAEPDWYGINAKRLPWDMRENGNLTELSSGIYCISATTLQQVYSRVMGPWCRPYENVYQRLLADGFEARDGSFHKVLDESRVAQIAALKELRFARLCAYLRHSEPIACVGHSILVFVVTPAQLNRALIGPPAELSPGINVRRD